MNHDLEIALAAARRWRDLGNTILLIGILAEVLIDACWPEHPHVLPLLRGRRATTVFFRWNDHFLSAKNLVMLFVGAVTLGGLLLERVEGTAVDDAANQIRINLQERLVSISPRTKLLTETTLKAFVAKLSPFAGQKVEVRFCQGHPTDSEPVILATRFMTQVFAPARWPTLGPTAENCMGTGVAVEISRHAPKATRDAAAALYATLKEFRFEPGDMVFSPPTTKPADDVVIFRVTAIPL